MKLMSALLGGQFLLTMFVVVKLFSIDGRIENYETAAERLFSSDTESDKSQSDIARIDMSGVSEVQLREIIREELVAHATTSAQPVVEIDRDAGSARADTPEYKYRLEKVSAQLDYFESVGEISSWEMERFHAEIAKLQATDRRRMLNRLVQSMNAGRIKGLF